MQDSVAFMYSLGSLGSTRMSHSSNRSVLGSHVVVDCLVSESGKAGPDVVLLAHFEILAEVLITAPPVQVDHAQALVPSNLMEVGVADVVLFTIGRETAISYSHGVPLVGLTQMPAPVLNHPLFLVFNHGVEEEALVQMEA